MDDAIEKLRAKRRRKARRFLFMFSIFSVITLLISPLLSMILGLILAGSAAYGLSPTMDLYRGFKSSALLSVISKEGAQEIYKAETEEVEKRKSQYWDLLVLIILGLSLFIVSIWLLSIGWGGVVAQL
jgi:predicted nucleic acid-binding Zn ribbon protein